METKEQLIETKERFEKTKETFEEYFQKVEKRLVSQNNQTVNTVETKLRNRIIIN